MKLKIKVIPEDFVVEEIATLPLVINGDYGAYLLAKRNWNTVELLQEISRSLKIPFRNFSYGGRKDRYGLTRQYISIKTAKRLERLDKNFSLKFIGTMNRPMGPDLIEKNRFQVTIRKLATEAIQRAKKEIEIISLAGYPNYFDDQRFGSFDPRQGFLAEKVLKKQWNGALKIYLASKDEIFSKAKTPLEKKALLQRIPREELTTHFSCFQASLWNEMLLEILRKTTLPPHKTYPGTAGRYLFYSDITRDKAVYLENLSIPTCGYRAKAYDKLSQEIYQNVLAAHELKNSMFNKIKLRQAYFKSFARQAVVKPQNIRYEVTEDELYKGRQKIVLHFDLPRGSFATMFLKRIFCETNPE